MSRRAFRPKWGVYEQRLDETHRAIRHAFDEDFRAMPHGVLAFMRSVASVASDASLRGYHVAQQLGVSTKTLNSATHRAQVLSAHQSLMLVRVVYIAAMLELPGSSVYDAAHVLSYSSPNTVARLAREVLGFTPMILRERATSTQLLERFRADFVWPYLDRYRAIHVLETLPAVRRTAA